MSNGKVKTYKNPARDEKENYKPYVPQYQIKGIEPAEHKIPSIVMSGLSKADPLPLDNPRAPRSAVRQPYAEAVLSPAVGRGRGPVPNVGNNMEHTWSSVNEEIVDDLNGNSALDPEHEMIDNNDYVTSSALGLPPEELPVLDEIAHPTQKIFSTKTHLHQNDLQQFIKNEESSNDLLSVIDELEAGTYLLIANGVSVCSGPCEEIQDQARALVFGEHELCDGSPIPVEDLIIVKKALVKVGLFLE